MLNSNDFLELSRAEFDGDGAMAYARLCGFYEACIWAGYTEEEIQVRLDQKCEDMRAKVNA